MPGEADNTADTSTNDESEAADESVDETPSKGDSLDGIADEVNAEDESQEEQDDEEADDEAADDSDAEDDSEDESDGDDDESSDDDESEDEDDSKDKSDDADDESDSESAEDEITDISQIDHATIKADEKYGIAPIELPKEFAKNKSVAALHDVMIKNSMQAFRNMLGVANRASDKATAANEKATAAETKQLLSEIDEAVKSGDIPAYDKLDNGLIDEKSEGGKVVTEVFKFMDAHNDKPENQNPSRQIKSFEVAHKLYSMEQGKQQSSADKKNEGKRRRAKGSMVGGGTKGKSSTKREFSDVPSKGMSMDDITDGLDL